MIPLLLFPTLHAAGYLICAHPRVQEDRQHPLVRDTRCQDCGAWKVNGVWGSVNLDYPREPYDISRP